MAADKSTTKCPSVARAFALSKMDGWRRETASKVWKKYEHGAKRKLKTAMSTGCFNDTYKHCLGDGAIYEEEEEEEEETPVRGL